MIRRRLSLMIAVWLVAVLATAAGLDVHVEDAVTGATNISVEAGSPVTYSVVGELGSGSQGLAVVLFDLAFSGGALAPVNLPSGPPMTSFVAPLGFDGNPSGFTGTEHAGGLVQVGGAQNIFAQGRWTCDDDRHCPDGSVCSEGVCSPVSGLPGGELVLGVAQPGNPVVLASGTVTAPDAPGTYSLQVTNVVATAVAGASTGDPFWVTEPVSPVTVAALTIEVTAGGGPPPVPKIPAMTPVGIAAMAFFLAGAAIFVLSRRRP